MAIRDVLASFKVNVDGEALDRFEKKAGKALDGLQKFGGYLIAGFAGNAVVDFVKSQLDMADALNDTSQKLGVASDDLERWQFVAQMSGSSAEGMAASLGFLNKAMGQAEEGSKEVVAAFAKLGVETKNADGSARELGDVLPDIVENWNKLESQGQKTTIAMKLFGKSGTQLIPMLNAGGEAASDLLAQFEELGGATPQAFIDKAAEVNDELDKQKRAVRMLGIQITSALLPAYRWLITHATQLITRFTKFAKETQFLHRMVKLLAIGGVGFLVLKLRDAAKEAKSAGALLKKLFGLGPKELLIVAALAVLYLLFDDLFTLLDGGQSVIGDTLDKFMGAGAAAEFADQLKTAWDEVRASLLEVGVDVGDLTSFFGKLGEVAIMAFAGITQAVTGVVQMVTSLVKLLISAVKTVAVLAKIDVAQMLKGKQKPGDVWDELVSAGKTTGGDLDLLGKGFNNLGGGFAKVGQGVVGAFGADSSLAQSQRQDRNMPWAPVAQLPAAAQSTQPARVDQQNRVEINLNGVGEKAGEVVETALDKVFKRQLKDAKGAL